MYRRSSSSSGRIPLVVFILLFVVSTTISQNTNTDSSATSSTTTTTTVNDVTAAVSNNKLVRHIHEQETVEVVHATDNKVILVMAYKRIDDFKRCLESMMQANHSEQYHLVITQSIPADNDRSHFDRMTAILNEQAVPHFKSVRHVETQSTSNHTYGNAYNAFKNLVRGLNYTMRAFPAVDSVIIVEEDVDVSKDIFEFFEKSRQLINDDPSVKLATSAFFLHTRHPQYDWRVDKPIKRKSIRNQMSLDLMRPQELVTVTLQGQIEFKVLAWMAHRSVCQQIVTDFYDVEEWVHKHGDHVVENKPNTPKPPLLVDHCDCWNHDRYLELRFKGKKFIGSQSPRCNHVATNGAGLSGVEDDYGFPVNQIYTHRDQFYMTYIKGEKGVWQQLKEYLPSVECPNRVDCFSPSTGQKCGSVRVSTCLNFWGLECVPCSGRTAATLEPQCREKYPECCGNQCETKSPFMISLPSLFGE